MATAKSQLQVNLPTFEMKFSRKNISFRIVSLCIQERHNIFEKVIVFSRRGSFPRLFSDSELNAVNFRSKTVCSYNVLHWVGHVLIFFSWLHSNFNKQLSTTVRDVLTKVKDPTPKRNSRLGAVYRITCPGRTLECRLD
jgi:hypothetical protein